MYSGRLESLITHHPHFLNGFICLALPSSLVAQGFTVVCQWCVFICARMAALGVARKLGLGFRVLVRSFRVKGTAMCSRLFRLPNDQRLNSYKSRLVRRGSDALVK